MICEDKKIKNVLPLLNLKYNTRVIVKERQHDVYVPLFCSTPRNIITRFGDYAIDSTIVMGNVMYLYVTGEDGVENETC